jgi:hypothetical protein
MKGLLERRDVKVEGDKVGRLGEISQGSIEVR